MIKFKEKQGKNSQQASSVPLNVKGSLRSRLKKSLLICVGVEQTEKHLYYFDTVEMQADGVENFAAIIVQKTNPKLNEIVEAFNHVVNVLKEKPE